MDETTPFLSDDFGRATKEALAKLGTVELPCPSPASGTLYIGINPDFNPDLPSVAPHFFLRLVQKVSPKQVITRIVGLDQLHGVSLPGSSKTEGGATREFRAVEAIADHISVAIDSLKKAKAENPGEYEMFLFEDVVIHVPESAPVFLRIQYEVEFSVNAAVAAENVHSLLAIGQDTCGPCYGVPH